MLEIKNIEKLTETYKDASGVRSYMITANEYKFHILHNDTHTVDILSLNRNSFNGTYKFSNLFTAILPINISIDEIKNPFEFIKWIKYLTDKPNAQ